MKASFFLVLLWILFACEMVDDPVKPIHCITTVVQVNSTDGNVISTETTTDFLYTREVIEKCKCSSDQGAVITRNISSYVVTIKTTAWFYPDSKE